MKKIVASLFFAVTAMLASLTACGSETARDTEMIKESVEAEENAEKTTEDSTMKITAGDITFTATLADNSSVEAWKKLLAEGPLTIHMSDYAGMEKVGPIGTNLRA